MIQVSTIAKPREPYTSQFKDKVDSNKKEWIPRQPQVSKTNKFEFTSINPSDYYAPKSISFKQNGTFILDKPCVAFVLCVGGSGQGSIKVSNDVSVINTGQRYATTWSDPIGGWQIDSHVDYKTRITYKRAYRTDYFQNPSCNPPARNGSASSFGKYLSANGGLALPQDTIIMYRIRREWGLHGKANIFDWGPGRYRDRTEEQNIKLTTGAYDGILRGCDGEIRFGIFNIQANEAVHVSVGDGEVKGLVDVVYFVLKDGNGNEIDTPSFNSCPATP